jgi:uncharacterized membrane protein YccF (DUF307 family)
MTLLLNILWFFLGGGLVAWFAWMALGLLLALTVVGIPFSVAAFRIASFAAWPFGRTLVDVRALGEDTIAGTDLPICSGSCSLACVDLRARRDRLCITIIGIPFGFAHFRLAMVCFAPLGKRAVELD